MKPHLLAERNRFCRLLPCWNERPEPTTNRCAAYLEAIERLAAEMIDDESTIMPRRPDYRIPAGFTYFGQFVVHDLIDDASSVEEAWRLEPEQIENRQSPRLNLGHLYGRGPWDEKDRCLYEAGDARLRVAPKVESILNRADAPRSFDIAIGRDDWPLVADRRTNENIILRQMTALFARLHNAAVEQFRPAIHDPHALFERARLQTTWQYQWLVVRDYFARVLEGAAYEEVFVRRQPKIEWKVFSLPVEFSAAAMRFGHTMVREQYLLSSQNETRLPSLIARAHAPKALEPEWQIDWGRFFQGASPVSATTAMPINTRLTKTLHRIPRSALCFEKTAARGSATSGNFALPFLTMSRGAALSLPPGQTVARAFGHAVLDEAALTRDLNGQTTAQGRVLLEANLTQATPLWFYLLKEAEVREDGNCLGSTGSRIVAETIFAALQHDPDSYLQHPDAAAEPPIWNFAGREERYRSAATLFAAVSKYL